MTRCRRGDFAVCIEGSATGTFVNVGDPHTHPMEPLAPAWLCEVLNPCDAVRHFQLGNRHATMPLRGKPGDKIIFLDRHLQPIRPPAPPEEIPAPPVEIETEFPYELA